MAPEHAQGQYQGLAGLGLTAPAIAAWGARSRVPAAAGAPGAPPDPEPQPAVA